MIFIQCFLKRVLLPTEGRLVKLKKVLQYIQQIYKLQVGRTRSGNYCGRGQQLIKCVFECFVEPKRLGNDK